MVTIRQPRQQRLGGRQSLLCLKVSVFVCPVWFQSEFESEALRDQKRRCRVSRNGNSVEADRRVKEASAASSGDALRSRKRDRRRRDWSDVESWPLCLLRLVASLKRRDWSDVESWPLCLLQFFIGQTWNPGLCVSYSFALVRRGILASVSPTVLCTSVCAFVFVCSVSYIWDRFMQPRWPLLWPIGQR